jgi:nitroreductase/NAD-dependent dihydropyrimidine dehydrogenase PreA subunit
MDTKPMTTPRVEINQELCDKEGLCVLVCVETVFFQKDRDSFPVVLNPEKCRICGHCIAVCPGDSITVHEMDPSNFHPITPEMAIKPEKLMDFLRTRRSVRNYNQKRRVRRGIVENILEASRFSPTAANAQGLNHILIDNRETIDLLSSHCLEIIKENLSQWREEAWLSSLEPEEADRIRADIPYYENLLSQADEGKDPIFYRAPVLVVTTANLSITPRAPEDATIASYQMMLMARSLGLGTCYIGNFYTIANESQEIRQILKVRPDQEVIIAFTLGYPAIRYRLLVDRKKPKFIWLE